MNEGTPKPIEKTEEAVQLQPAKVQKLHKVWLDELDVSKAISGWGTTQVNKSIDGNVMTINGKQFNRGLGTHASGCFIVKLNKAAKRFVATVGADDEVGDKVGSVEFIVIGDKKTLYKSGVMQTKDDPKEINLDISGIDELRLMVDEAGESNFYDHANWANAYFEVAGVDPVAVDLPRPKPYILTPKPGPEAKITGPKVFGVKPGSPFLFTVTATGNRPMTFAAENLPGGLTLNAKTGRITGKLDKPGQYEVKLMAVNVLGKSERKFRIVVGDTICLTPPMGWNSWNCWARAVDDNKIRAAAKSIVDSGLVNHGWSYVNIDDCWMRKLNTANADKADFSKQGWHIPMTSTDERLGGPARDEDGNLLPNKDFPNMVALTDYIHGLGLKAGLYISPGPWTCQHYVGSWKYEQQDAQIFADWGFDYLKYDWCGYGHVSGNQTLEELKLPYEVMRDALAKVDRDIVYSICQYGWGDVHKWGEEMNGNCWRTTGDIVDSWSSLYGIGFSQHDRYAAAKPGHWNDPDMLIVGKVGWGPNLHPTRLTPDEQYTHISLWCLLSAPLLIGCDMTDMDEFTISLLTNDEVLDVNQDPLGDQAQRIVVDDNKQIWAKDMEDGSQAVGLFNLDGFEPQEITVKWSDLKIKGDHTVRDLWRQKDMASSDKSYTVKVPAHGVVLVKISKK
ncbi:MAG: NPCBM/NEW2 domain-containing protein [Phycisphaerae bacterium]|nr:NPCBM/NEW2 domain-containing protein [Phycisphaerae bacterium]